MFFRNSSYGELVVPLFQVEVLAGVGILTHGRVISCAECSLADYCLVEVCLVCLVPLPAIF